MAITKPVHSTTDIISKIKLGDKTYELHDAEVDALVSEVEKVESRVTATEGVANGAKSTADQAVKDAAAAQATANEAKSTADAATTNISNLTTKVTNLETKTVDVNDKETSGEFVTHVTKAADGTISTAKKAITAAMVSNGSKTLAEWITSVDAAVEKLANTDSEDLAALADLIQEIKDGSADGEFADTLIDKLKGLDNKTVKAYVDDAVAAAKAAAATDAQSKADAAKAAAIADAKSFVGTQGFATTTEVEAAKAAAKSEAISTVQGSTGDNKDAKTVEGAKKYADSLAVNYATAGHDHDNVYSKLNHDHNGVYAPATHAHADYSAKTHTHSVSGWNFTVTDGVLTIATASVTSGAASA